MGKSCVEVTMQCNKKYSVKCCLHDHSLFCRCDGLLSFYLESRWTTLPNRTTTKGIEATRRLDKAIQKISNDQKCANIDSAGRVIRSHLLDIGRTHISDKKSIIALQAVSNQLCHTEDCGGS